MSEPNRLSETWRALLTGEDTSIRDLRRVLGRIPSPPRCKICGSPFHGVGGAVGRLVWHGPMPNNPLLCKACFGKISKEPGGAVIEISVVFADVRGSTALAERSSSGEFRALLQDYYRSAAYAIDANAGIVDKFLGDGVMSLFVPVITGENHARRAIEGARAILAGVERDGLARRGLMVGAGVHAGEAFLGVVGSAEKTDFTALGDTVNVAARLGSMAGPGELLISDEAWRRAGLGPAPAEREVEIAGRSGTLRVVVENAPAKAEEQPAAVL